MGKRGRRWQREAAHRPLPPNPPPPAVYDSGLLEGQTQPEMRKKVQLIGDSLRDRYGTAASWEAERASRAGRR